MTTYEASSSSSSSSSSKLWKYDVFLSYRGEDTRNGFTGHLHAALKDRGYEVFIEDDDLKCGEEIKEEIFQAIEESRISIIVFSKGYAASSWCLDDLVKIMECRHKLGREIFPIFYDVHPSHVRRQSGYLAKAFQKHEYGICETIDDKESEVKKERVKQWRKALTEAANLSGSYLNNGHEAKLIRRIVDEDIHKLLPSTNELHVANYPVGIDSRVQPIISDLSSGGSNDVIMVGIWGMGGLGKTTAAKAIYNQIHHSFQFKCFLADVSDTASRHGLVYVQEKLVSNILKQSTKFQINSVDAGISVIKQHLRRRRVLLVIDNVDKVGQLNAIAGNRDWFGPGSIIIITTRDEHLLTQLKVNKTYPAQEMNEEEALGLFSWHTFHNSCPNNEYLELSKKIVSHCGGLPSALQVLGSSLIGKPITEWGQLGYVPANNMANSAEWIFLVSSLCMEILSAACDQASSPSRPRYALFGMFLAAALLTCILELIYKGRKQNVRRERECYKLFGTAIESYGLVGGIAQCVCSIIQYVCYSRRTENPIKLSLLLAILYV